MEKEVKDCNCEIEFLLSSPFQKLKLEDKLKYFKLYGPRSNLDLKQEAKKDKINYTRHFCCKLYNDLPWLCGCPAKNGLFCWPCLLFARNESIWNTRGYKDLKNLSKYAKTHTTSSNHLLSMKDMRKFSKLYFKQKNSNDCINKNEKLIIELHNLKAKEERKKLKKLIKVIGVLVKLGYVFDAVDSENATSCWNSYLEMMNLVANYDNDIRNFLSEKKENAMMQYQNILTALSNCMLKEIKREVSETVFVMLIFDRVIDVTSKSYVATTLRYIKKNGRLVERFLYFTEWPELVGGSVAFNHILNVLKEFDCHSKLIGFTYDGEMVLAGQHEVVKELVKRETRAFFIHYYGHNLSSVLMQVISTIPAVKTFFASLAVIGKFFSKPTAAKVLESEIKKNSPDNEIEIKWEDPIHRLETVFNYRSDIISSLSAIVEKPKEFSADVVTSASSLLVVIKDVDFKFLLLTLEPVFLKCDILFQIIRYKINDPSFLIRKISEFQGFLSKLSQQFEKIWKSTIDKNQSIYSLKLNSMCKVEESIYFNAPFSKLYDELFQILIQTISERFGDTILKQNLFCLLNQNMFKEYRVHFPKSTTLARLSELYLMMIPHDNLKKELEAIYSDDEFEEISDLHDYLMVQELEDVFPSVFKLTKFMTTLPLASKPGTISERIQDFIGSGKKGVDFPLFVIERELLDVFLEQQSFIEQTVDEFCEKAGRLDLIYKDLPKESNSSTVFEIQKLDSNDPGPSEFNIERNPEPAQLDSFLAEEFVPIAHDVNYQSLDININQESEGQFLKETVEGNAVASESLFLSPAIIKEEIVFSDDELQMPFA